MTGNTSTLSNRETFIQRLHGFAGLILDGLETSSEIKLSRNGHTTVITITDSCVRSSDTEATTEANPTPSPSKPNSLSGWSLDSSQSTSPPFLLTLSDSNGLIIDSVGWAVLKLLLDEKGGFLGGVAIRRHSGRLMLTIPRAPSPT